MSGSLLTDPPGSCGMILDHRPSGSETKLYVLCTRPRGHRDTGHEFAGDIGGVHVHIIWGEPLEPGAGSTPSRKGVDDAR